MLAAAEDFITVACGALMHLPRMSGSIIDRSPLKRQRHFVPRVGIQQVNANYQAILISPKPRHPACMETYAPPDCGHGPFQVTRWRIHTAVERSYGAGAGNGGDVCIIPPQLRQPTTRFNAREASRPLNQRLPAYSGNAIPAADDIIDHYRRGIRYQPERPRPRCYNKADSV